MQYSQEHLKTMVYAKFGGQTECIMGNWKIENEMIQIIEMFETTDCFVKQTPHTLYLTLEKLND